MFVPVRGSGRADGQLALPGARACGIPAWVETWGCLEAGGCRMAYGS
jgi:hypothetical protein